MRTRRGKEEEEEEVSFLLLSLSPFFSSPLLLPTPSFFFLYNRPFVPSFSFIGSPLLPAWLPAKDKKEDPKVGKEEKS